MSDVNVSHLSGVKGLFLSIICKMVGVSRNALRLRLPRFVRRGSVLCVCGQVTDISRYVGLYMSETHVFFIEQMCPEVQPYAYIHKYSLPAGCVWSARLAGPHTAGPKIASHFPHLFARWSVGVCIPTYHVQNNCVTYIVAMQPYFSRLRQFRWLLCVATMSSLAQLRVWDGYWEAEQCRCDVRLAKSGNARISSYSWCQQIR